MPVFRDPSGNIISYNAPTDGNMVSLEVALEKLNGRVERIESNLGDARLDIQRIFEFIEKLQAQTSQVASSTREMTNEVRLYAKLHADACYESRLSTIEIQHETEAGIKKARWNAFKNTATGTGIVGTVAAVIFGILKFLGR